MNEAAKILLVMSVLGISFGFIIAYANKKFKIEVNPLIHIVDDILPKGQCGACGYAGCMAYAEAVVLDPNVPPNLCLPGKDEVAAKVATLTNKEAEAIEPQVARLLCSGTMHSTKYYYKYDGAQSCAAANLLFDGNKSCRFGCLGLGSCIANCPFEALSVNEDGLAVVDESKCTACGICQKKCPKNIIRLVPLKAKVLVRCNSHYKGTEVKNVCSVGCIACGICMRKCPHGAISMEDNLPVVDNNKCQICTDFACVDKCPTGAIVKL